MLVNKLFLSKLFSLCFVCLISLKATADFQSDYDYFYNNPQATLSAEEIEQARNFHFVLIAGFLNETDRKNYFLGVQKNLNDLGITSSRLFPSTIDTVESGTARLINDLESLHTLFNLPLIGHTHSWAGPRLLNAIITKPDLVLSGKLAQIIPLQAPIGGNQLFLNIKFASWLSKWSPLPQIRALNPENLEHFLADKLAKFRIMYPEEYHQLSLSVQYVTTYKEPSKMSLVLGILGRIIKGKDETSNDGFVATKYQMLRNFGQVLGLLKGFEHIDLTLPNNPDFERRQSAYTKALVRNSLNNLRGENGQYQELTRKFEKEFFNKNGYSANRCVGLFN